MDRAAAGARVRPRAGARVGARPGRRFVEAGPRSAGRSSRGADSTGRGRVARGVAGLVAMLCLALAAAWPGAGRAQQDPAGPVAPGFSARATLDPEASAITARRGGLDVALALSQGVPYRIFTLRDPRRIVMDFREIDWRGLDPAPLARTDRVTTLAAGPYRPGWSRLVIGIDRPLALERADMRIDPASGTARLEAAFRPVEEARFADLSGAPGDAPVPAAPPAAPEPGEGGLRILLDPGHGGIDPGAERAGVVEAELMLTFARELKEVLQRSGAEVLLTRDDDRFVPLERRVAMAHELRADLFVSLHADALPSGRALGTTVHTLARQASDEASRLLAERHDRADLLAGIDLSGSDDEVADVLMDLARQETQPRSERLADAIVLALRQGGLPLNTRPRRAAGYSVLKAPDVPSVLVETGFLSSRADRERLVDPAFRARLAAAIRDGVLAWKIADDTLAPLRLK